MKSAPNSAIEYKKQWEEQQSDIPYGECWCGCGQLTNRARQTDSKSGWIKNEPVHWIAGHNAKPQMEFCIQDRGYKTPCWIWQGSKSKTGYGHKWLWPGTDPKGRKCVRAHRWYYEWTYGEIPQDKVLHHVCHVRLCCRPSHLQVVDRSEHIGNHKRRLSHEDRVEIAHLYATTNLLGREIAERFGVCQAHVSLIANRMGVRRERSFSHINKI